MRTSNQPKEGTNNMATKQAQKKIQPKQAKELQQVADINSLASEYIATSEKLKKDLKKFTPVEARISELKKEIVKFGNDTLPPDAGLEVATKEGTLKIGVCATQREITNIDKAIEFLGMETFMKLAKISLSDLDKYLNPEQIAMVTETKVTEQRRITF